ncbi:hypothetical protein L1787_13330 [Acuticoccus sp. M5D2P5]|uniref:hypothetical protein n=1 Tax=Acuticoccus kalidii TaxID=2910977 RepID=UPI001F3F68A2|nr:hypothetical protein [Acuticoccus kalidii]MCF3934388.1 hypothetical protein [Acuticoccus kalidii]
MVGRWIAGGVAALMLAFLVDASSLAHAMPCPDETTATNAAALGDATDRHGHADHEGRGASADSDRDPCCPSPCMACVSVMPPVPGLAGIVPSPGHILLAGTRSVGLTRGPPHGPPRL